MDTKIDADETGFFLSSSSSSFLKNVPTKSGDIFRAWLRCVLIENSKEGDIGLTAPEHNDGLSL